MGGVGRLKTKYAVIDNLRIRYQDSATAGAKTLIFIHGLGGSIESWDSNTGQLSKKYRTVVFDLPGFGLSDKPRKNYTIGFFSSFVMQAVRRLNIEFPINIIGSSLGGQIAANIAVLNPNVVDKLGTDKSCGFYSQIISKVSWSSKIYRYPWRYIKSRNKKSVV